MTAFSVILLYYSHFSLVSPHLISAPGLGKSTRIFPVWIISEILERSSRFILLSTHCNMQTIGYISQLSSHVKLLVVVCRTCWSCWRNCPTEHRQIKSAATSISSSGPSTGVTRMRLCTEVKRYLSIDFNTAQVTNMLSTSDIHHVRCWS